MRERRGRSLWVYGDRMMEYCDCGRERKGNEGWVCWVRI